MNNNQTIHQRWALEIAGAVLSGDVKDAEVALGILTGLPKALGLRIMNYEL
jgi:hypothetical protein